MGSSKKKIAQLEQRLKNLAKQHDLLAGENRCLKSKAETLHDLLLQRNALLNVLERVETASAVGIAACAVTKSQQQQQLLQLSGDEQELLHHLLQQLPTEQPLHEALTGINQQLYDVVRRLTPATAAEFWVDKVKDVALLWHMYERDPVGTLPALAAVTAECMSWCNAVHIFNPSIMYSLHDYNLVTHRYEKFDTAGVKASLASGTLTSEQLQHTQTLLSIVQPRLEQLEQEKQQLLAEIDRLDEQFSADCAAQSSEAVNWCRRSGQRGGSSSSGSDSECSISDRSSDSTLLLRRREELLQSLNRNYTAWRVTTQMRGQWLTVSLTAQQAAQGILASFPYMPYGAPVFDATRSSSAASEHHSTGVEAAVTSPQPHHDFD